MTKNSDLEISVYLEQERELLDQGEVIQQCPVFTWDTEAQEGILSDDPLAALGNRIGGIYEDVVVITPTCDLVQRKTKFIAVCVALNMQKARMEWVATKGSGFEESDEKWNSFLSNVANDKINHHMYLPSGVVDGANIPDRIVNLIPTIYLPTNFLQEIVTSRDDRRIRLNSPYREKLSLRYAQLYSRIGTPEVWFP